MGFVAAIELVAAVWDARAYSDLLKIKSDTPAQTGEYKQMVADGGAMCLAVRVNGERRGTAICTFLEEGDTRVFVCNAVAVELVEGREISRELYEVFEVWARSSGAQKLRFWTARPGLAAKAKEWGFQSLYVMEKDVNHVGWT